MKIRKVSKRMLAGLLCLSLLAGLFPGLQLVPVAQAASDGTTVDAFGITMYQFDEQARLEAEQATPLGVGYGTRSALLAKHELFINNAANQNTQRAGVIDLNGSAASTETAVSNIVTHINMDTQLTRTGAPYRFLESAAFNPGTGRDEYVVQLGYRYNELDLILTNTTNNKQVAKVTISSHITENFAHLNALSGYRVAGSIAVCCGDFDGDGVDSIIAFIPELGFYENQGQPYIVEYTYNPDAETKLVKKDSLVVEDLWDLLDLPHIQDVSANSCPRVSLVAEDTDLDGFDELVITASVGDTPYADNSGTYEGNLGSQLFVYELYDGDFDESEGAAPNPTWHQSAHFELSADKKTANEPYRIVWASATVGNLIASTSTTEADYPEIFAAGYIDQSASANGWHIDVGDTNMGYSIMRVADNTKRETYPTGQLLDPENEKSNGYAQNVVCTYEMLVQDQQVNNEFTQDGFYTDEETWGIFQVQAFADRGVNSAESVFISGSVYRVIDSGKLQKMTDNTYFDTSDNAAPGSTILAQTSVMDVIAGNFDGNDYGREQIICVTALKKATVNYQDYSRIYYIYNKGDRVNEADELTTTPTDFHCDEGPYVASSQRPMYISLAAVDNDDDSVIVQLEEVTRSYTEPDVLAILEAPPYFAEIEPSTDNSATVYGNSSTTGGGYGNSFGFNAGVIVGAEPALFATGPSWELSINNTFNWGFSHTTSTEIFQEFSNDSGENQVVVYRCPVVNYKYVDEDGNAIVISKPGQPALSTITEQQYNDAVEQYTAANLDSIPEGMLGTAGDPDSYRSNEYGLVEYIGANTTGTQQGANWVQYSGGSTITQGITVSQEDTRDFDYNLDIDFQITGEVLGAYAGGQFGLHYEHETSSFSGTSVTKSGSVTSQNVPGYDFQWKFAAWDVTLNGQSVPVLGYLVQDVVAPPSPAANLDVETVGTDSATLAWQVGVRAAQEYRIYRVFENGMYTLLGAVDGSEFSYTLTGLQPGDTYTYVVRGVAYEADGDESVSVDSAPVVVTTRDTNAADVDVVITGATDGAVTSSGAEIKLGASAVVTGQSRSVSYNWQLRRAGGLSNWENLSQGVSGVGSASGATRGDLTLKNVGLALDGAQLRCVVTAVSQDGTPNYYYSDAVTLILGRDETETELTITGYENGSGTAENPYTGYADYTTSSEEQYEVTELVTVANSDTTLSVYQDDKGGSYAYIGVGTNEDGESVYYKLTKTGDDYTAGDELTFGKLTWGEYAPKNFDGTPDTITENKVTYRRMALLTTPTDENGNVTGETTFTEYWMVEEISGEGDNVTVKYYTQDADGSFTEVTAENEVTKITNGDLRTVFKVPEPDELDTGETGGTGGEETGPSAPETTGADTDNMLILDLPEPPAVETEGTGDEDETDIPEFDPEDFETEKTWYVTYTIDEDGKTLTEADNGTFFSERDGKLYENVDDDNAYADTATMTAVTKTKTQTTTVTTPHDGTSLTLTATVSPESGAAIDYTITNLSTGVSSTQRADANGQLIWRATASGLYRITAVAQAAGIYAGSTATKYYQAGAVAQSDTTEYRLLLQSDGKNVDSLIYAGQEVAPVLQSRTAATVTVDEDGNATVTQSTDDWTDVTNFTYTVNNEAESGNYKVDCSGTFLFTAYVKGENNESVAAASAQLEVTRANITISPVWDGMEGDGNTVPSYDDIKLKTEGPLVQTDKSLLDKAIDIRCSLYDDKNGMQATDVSGLFDVTLQYKQPQDAQDSQGIKAAVDSLQSKYTITFGQAQILRPSSAIAVSYSAGANGTIDARYISNGTEFTLTGSQSVPVTYGLKFTAYAKAGFQVSAWQIKVDGVELDLNQESLKGLYSTTDYENGQILSIASIQSLLNAVKEGTEEKQPERIEVSVTFTNESYTVTFEQPEEGGALTAAQNGNAISSGMKVAGGSSVVFTAAPEDGYVVAGWRVTCGEGDQAESKNVLNDDGTPFTGTELTLEDIDADTTVRVAFAEAKDVKVTFTAVDPDGNTLTSGVTLKAKGVEDGTAQQGTQVTLIAEPTTGSAVLEWQQKNEEGEWVTIAESQGSYTIESIQNDVEIRVVVNTSGTMYEVTFGVADSDGTALQNGGALSAEIGGNAIESGSSQLAGSNITFTFREADAYEVVKWTINGAEVTPTPVDDSTWIYTYEYQNLITALNLQVTVQEKPVVTILESDYGEVSVTVDGQEITSDTRVYTGTDLVVTLTPKVGYVVAGDAVPADSDTVNYTIENVQADETIAPAFMALDTYTVTYSVADTGSGEHGSLSASYDRKGMESYAGSLPGTTVYEGGTLTFTATPENGYRVQEWRVNDVPQESDGVTYIGNTLSLGALPLAEGDTGYTVTVAFTQIGTYTTVSAGENGSITQATVSGTDVLANISSGFQATPGTTVAITAEPYTGYEVASWYVNGVEVADTEQQNMYSYTVDETESGAVISVSFQPVQYSVSWSGGGHSTVSVDGYESSPASIRGGTPVTFTAEPEEGYIVDGWTVNDTLQEGVSGNEFKWTVPTGEPEGATYVVAPTFNTGSFSVNFSQPANGSLAAVAGGEELASGNTVAGYTQVTFTVTPQEGYEVSGWTVNGEPVADNSSNQLTIAVTAKTTVAVTLARTSYTVTYGANGSGTVSSDSGASPLTVQRGESVTFAATPEEYYYVSGWTVTGTDDYNVSVDKTQLTLNSVEADITVTANFAVSLKFEVGFAVEGGNGALTATANGETITPQTGGVVMVSGGSELRFTATPDDDHMVAKWQVSTDNGQTYTDVTRDNMASYGMEHHLGNTLTVDSLTSNLQVKVSFEPYVGYNIPVSQNGYEIKDVKCNPDDAPDGEIRRGGDLTFTVGASAGDGYVTLSTLEVNGYDCLTGEGTPTGCEGVTAKLNADGSYTVTITGVNEEIETNIVAHKVIITSGLENINIPEGMPEEADTPEKIEQALVVAIEKKMPASDGTVTLDIALKYWDSSQDAWVDVDPNNFPADGVQVVIPYNTIHEDATQKDSYVVAHMITSGEKMGQTELMNVTNTPEGLTFTATSLSPFAVSWKKYVAPTPPFSGGGGGMMGGYAITVLPTDRGTVSASETSADAGQEVTVTLDALSGYSAGGITVTDEQGNPVAVTGSGGVYRFTMPESAVTVRGQFLCLGEDNPNCPSLDFTDLNANQWYHEAVDYVLTRGLMNGMGDDIFDPNGSLTRAMLVQILWRLEGQPVVNYLLPFTDVEDDDWYTEAVRWAASEGIVNGVSETSFAPDEAITREQLATMLHRYAKGKGYEAPSGGMAIREFKDYAEISSWALQSMHWAVDSGLMNGKGDDILDPTGTATRAEVSKILSVFCQNFDL